MSTAPTRLTRPGSSPHWSTPLPFGTLTPFSPGSDPNSLPLFSTSLLLVSSDSVQWLFPATKTKKLFVFVKFSRRKYHTFSPFSKGPFISQDCCIPITAGRVWVTLKKSQFLFESNTLDNSSVSSSKNVGISVYADNLLRLLPFLITLLLHS